MARKHSKTRNCRENHQSLCQPCIARAGLRSMPTGTLPSRAAIRDRQAIHKSASERQCARRRRRRARRRKSALQRHVCRRSLRRGRRRVGVRRRDEAGGALAGSPPCREHRPEDGPHEREQPRPGCSIRRRRSSMAPRDVDLGLDHPRRDEQHELGTVVLASSGCRTGRPRTGMRDSRAARRSVFGGRRRDEPAHDHGLAALHRDVGLHRARVDGRRAIVRRT